MLVVLNGAQKGGSTWLVQIARALRTLKRVPERYQEPSWKHSSIRQDVLSEFIDNVDFVEVDYYCKQHWKGLTRIRPLLYVEGIRMLNIIRDIRDVLVSRYFYDINFKDGQMEVSFPEYARQTGMKKMANYIDYHLSWHRGEPEPFLISYEDLHLEFRTSVHRIAEYLGVAKENVKLKAVQRKSNFEQKHETNPKFFRKGIVGDWHNHFDERVEREMKELIERTGYGELLEDLRERKNIKVPDDLITGNWR